MRPSHLSYAFLLSFIAMIFMLQWWQQPAYPRWVWMFIGLLGITGLLGLRSKKRKSASAIFIASLIGISLAFITVSRTAHVLSAQTVDFYTHATVAVRGIVADDPDRRIAGTNYTVETDALEENGTVKPVTGRVLVSEHAGSPAFAYGDRVVVTGSLERPRNFGGFAYDDELSRYDVYSVMRDGAIQSAGPNAGNPLLAELYALRGSIEDRINAMLPEPDASLLAGVLLGARRRIPAGALDDLNNAGLTHIVTVSGYKIALLVAGIGTLLFWVPLRWRFVPSVLLIAAFTLLAGATAAATRAAIVATLGLFAVLTGRMTESRLALLWATFFMLAANPKILWYDAGFQISVLAVIGILELSPFLHPHLRWIPDRFGMRETACLTIAVQAMAGPWMLLLFGQLSLIAPLSNVLAQPTVPVVMLIGIAGLGTGMLLSHVATIVMTLAWLPLEWIMAVAHWLSRIPFASVGMHDVPVAAVAGYYACAAAAIACRNTRPLTTRTAGGFSAFPSAPEQSFPTAGGAENGMNGK